MNRTQVSPGISVHGGPVVRGKRKRRDRLNPLSGWHCEVEHLLPIGVTVQGYALAIGAVVGHAVAGHAAVGIAAAGYVVAAAAAHPPVIRRLNTADWCNHDINFGWPAIQFEDTQAREDSLAEKFHRLVDQWYEETAGMSSPSLISSNRAYLSIIALGPPVVPLILREMKRRGGFWYPALRALTDANPVPTSARGKTRQMTEAWLSWGEQFELLD